MTSSDAISNEQDAAKRNLWLHFTRMSAYTDSDVPVIVRGSGAYVFDQHGKRYLDGLSGLFVSQVGHGRTESRIGLRAHPEGQPAALDHLLEILGRVRAVPFVTSTETFVYLKLRKQTYSWGTR